MNLKFCRLFQAACLYSEKVKQIKVAKTNKYSRTSVFV